jgi:hypothetical protein
VADLWSKQHSILASLDKAERGGGGKKTAPEAGRSSRTTDGAGFASPRGARLSSDRGIEQRVADDEE